MLFDTHAHMDDRAFDEDRGELLASLPGQGIGLLMNPGCSLASSRNAAALAREYDYIYAAVGSHPDAADEVNPEVLAEYRTLCRENPKIRAIGEIGLDYHYEDIPRDRQQTAFRAQMGLARELGLPVIVHEREAHEDGIRIVEEFPEVTGVFHCYSGSAEMAKWLIRRGWYIGFTGVLTFKNARPSPWSGSCWKRTAPTCLRSHSGASATTQAGSTGWRKSWRKSGACHWRRYTGSPLKTENDCTGYEKSP